MISFKKQLIAQLAAAGALALAVWLGCEMRAPYRDVATALLVTFLVAGCMVGCGLFARLQKTDGMKQFRSDCRMFIFTGLGVLVAVLGVFLMFAGVRDILDESGREAANWMILVLSMFPLPFLTRAAACSLFSQDDNKPRRTVMRVITAALWLAAVVLTVCGLLFGLIPAVGV